MLAPLQLPQSYAEWNHIHGAPDGRGVRRWKKLLLPGESLKQLRGPFAMQPNNTTRRFEYPWAYDVSRLTPGMRVLEIGGGMAGFQFVLDKIGCQVVNIDPGMAAKEWPCNNVLMEKVNKRFGTRVELRNTTIEKANLVDDSFDRAFSISVIEHLPAEDAKKVMFHAHRALKTGGLFVLTTDLFLNLHPFCSRQTNEHGGNQNMQSLIDETAWELIVGERNSLYGFQEFDADVVMNNLEKYLIGYYPALAQCVVLKKR
jgi:SAM-dependent methyltransferase